MDKVVERVFKTLLVGLISFGALSLFPAQPTTDPVGLDARVSRFLEEARPSWSDGNIPYQDGKLLYPLVVQGPFRDILELGTATGHSSIWLAWAASKTGGLENH